MTNIQPSVFTLGQTLLSLRGVSKSYDNVPVLSGVTRDILDVRRPDHPEIKQGQVVGLLGPSGVGKSTLLRIIAGLEAPDAGQILIGPEQTPTQMGQVGAVFQNYPLLDDRSVLSNLVFGARRGGLRGKEAKDRAMEMLERFGLADQAKSLPAKLSGGQRQRVAIAQQLLCSNHLLILDEPFSGLDTVKKGEACDIILETSRLDEEMTILVITHDVHECVKVSDEIWMFGREHHPNGKPIPGASVKIVYDLKAMGLAWHPELTDTQAFFEFERLVYRKIKEM